MIYGEKFLNTNNNCIDVYLNLYEQDLNFINNLMLEGANVKLSFSDIVKKIVDKLRKFISILIDKISTLFKEAIPKLYEAAQKLIVKIKGSDINYQGIKEISVTMLKPECEKEINSYQDIFNLDEGLLSRYEMAHKVFTSDIESFLSSRHYRFDKKIGSNQLKNIIGKYNNAVNSIYDDLRKNTDKYIKYWAYNESKGIDISRFFEVNTFKIESANDYEKLMSKLKEQLNGNKSSSSTLAETVRELNGLSKRLAHAADEIYKSDKAMEEKAREIYGTTDNYFTYAKKNGADFTKDPYDDANKEAIKKSSDWGYNFISRQEFDELVDRNISGSPVGIIAKQIPKIGSTILKIHVTKIKYLIKAYNDISKACLNEALEMDEVNKSVQEVIS